MSQSEQMLKSAGELREIAVLTALPSEELGAIAETAERQVLHRGSLIGGEDAADFVYAIIHGEVRLSVVSLQGREIANASPTPWPRSDVTHLSRRSV